MAEITFEELVQAAQKLSPEKKAALVATLQPSIADEDEDEPTIEQLNAELEALRASGAFKNVESMYGLYANAAAELSEDELFQQLREIGTEWEKELDEFFDDNDSTVA
jgi:hypothetical protein